MDEWQHVTPQVVVDASCPRCGVDTDTFVSMTDDPTEPPIILYCLACDHQWINLANLPEGD